MRLFALASMLTTAACASAPPPTVASPPVDEPRQLAPLLPSGAAELRYNPARCPCSPWEVKLKSGWERVQLVDGSEDGRLLEELESQLKAGRDQPTKPNPLALVEPLEEAARDGAGHPHGQLLIRGLATPKEGPSQAPSTESSQPPADAASPPAAPQPETAPGAVIAPVEATPPDAPSGVTAP